MKKIYLLLSALGLGCTLGYAQQAPKTAPQKGKEVWISRTQKTYVVPTKPNATSGERAATLSEGFEGTVPPANWTLADVDGDGYNWEAYTPSPHSGNQSASSASWISGVGPLTPNNYIITPQMTVTAAGNVTFWVAAQDPDWPAEAYELRISTTGNAASDFTTVLDGATLADDIWVQKTVDLSAYVGQDVYLAWVHTPASQDNFKIKLDDVECTVCEVILPSDDIALNAGIHSEYTQIPLSQVQPITFIGAIENTGSTTQTNVTVNVDVNSGLYTGSASNPSMAPGDVDTLTLPNTFTPSGIGTYDVTFNVTQDQTDANPANSTSSGTFAVSDTVYSRDLNVLTGSDYYWNGAGQPYEVGNGFDIITPGLATSGSVVFWLESPGVEVRLKLYDFSGQEPVLVAASDFYTLQATDFPTTAVNPKAVTLPLNFDAAGNPLSSPYELDPAIGYYVLMVENLSTTDTVVVAGSNVPNKPDFTSWIYDETGTLYYITYTTPMVRLNVTQPPCSTPLTFNPSTVTNTTCGASNGGITINVSNGTAPYSATWTGTTGNSLTVSGLAAGTYSAVVTDANGCSGTKTETLTNTGTAPTLATTTVSTTCGSSNGSATVAISGGTSPFTTMWTPGNISGETLSNVSAGTYVATVTDNAGCTATATAVIADEPAPTVTVATTNASCSGSGTANAIVNGGTSPFTYSWSNGSTTSGINAGAGTYTVVVTDDNGCTATASGTVGMSAANFTVSATEISSTCGNANGSATVTVTPAGNYTFVWETGDTTATASNLIAGDYDVIVSDGTCDVTVTITVTNMGMNPLLDSIMVTEPSVCGADDGKAVLAVSGIDSTFTYSWVDTSGAVISTTDSITGVGAGAYGVTITDSVGCSASYVAAISDPGAPTITLTKVDVACFGGSNGSIDATVTGGTGNYTFEWTNNATTEDISGLVADAYGLVVTDNGCTASAVEVITEPDVIFITGSVTDVTCAGASNGAINVTVAGGNPNYTYAWSGASTATTEDLTAIAGGSYTLTVTDNNTCTMSKTFTVAEPLPLTVAISGNTSIACFGNSTTLTAAANGGTGAANYSWSNGPTSAANTVSAGGDYIVIVTDGNGCTATDTATVVAPTSAVTVSASATPTTCGATNGTASAVASGGTGALSYLWTPSGGNTANATGLAAGTYTVTVADANLCTASATATVGTSSAVTITSPVSGSSIVNSAVASGNGTVTVTASGGTGALTYAWTGTSATTATASNLSTGSYSVTVTDANGCSATTSFTASFTLGIRAITSATELNVYPNPASSNLTISFNAGKSVNASVRMVSMTGQIVYSENIKGLNGEYKKTLDLSGMAKGLYYMQISTGEKTVTKKVVVQ